MTEDAVVLAAAAVSNRHVSVVKEKAKEILEALQVRARALSPCARVRIGRSASHNCVYPEPQTKVHKETWGTWGWESKLKVFGSGHPEDVFFRKRTCYI